MNSPNITRRLGVEFIRCFSHLAIWMATILSLCLPLGGASESASSKAVLALYSLDRDSPLDLIFDQSFQKALSSDASAPIEYYSEFMDSFRFSGDSYSQLLLDYLRQKYAERNIDVVVVNGVPALHFRLIRLPLSPIRKRERGEARAMPRRARGNPRSGAADR